MANIDEYIKQIQQAQYGEEVRDSIVNALKKVNDDNNSYVAIKKEVVAAKDIVEEKAEIFDEKANAAKETLTALQASTQIANEAKSSLNNIISSAISTKKELEQAVLETGEVIARVDNAKSNLDKSITSAGKAELNLQRQIETSNQIKNQLDVSNNTAIELKKNLDVAINEANTAKVKLVEAINNAGNAALENIKTAQNTATQAVETAKSEAIKAVQTEGTTQTGAVTAEGEKQVQAVQAAAQEIIADREQIQKNKTDIADLRQNKADAIVETASGTLLNVKDSAYAFFEDFSVYGKSEQVQTTGKNILNIPNIDINTPETVIECNISKNICISVQEKAMVSKSVWRFMALYKNNDKQYITDASLPGVFYATSENPIVSIICRGIMITSGVYRGIMVEYGEAATSYEPYTGEKPSPSPEYPQDVVNAGRLNEDTGKYEVDAKVTGKNIVNIPDISADTPGGTILCRIVDNAVVSAQEKAVASSDVWHICFYSKDGKKQYFNGTETHKAITATPKNPIIKLEYRNVYITSGAYKGIMVEYGTVATPYEPYKEQTLTLTSDRPLTKWDRLVEQDGQIGWLYKGKQYIVTGEESLRIPVDLPSYIYGNTTSSFLAISNNDFSDKKGYLNKLPYIPEVWISQSNKEGYCLNTTNQLHVRFANTRLNIEDTASISEREKAIKAHIKQQYDAGTPYMLWYESLQEEFVPLPQEQQNAIRALTTYYPTTVVTNSEDTEMQLTYVADTKNYTDRKIEQAVSAQVQNLANLLSLMPLSTQAAMIEADTNNILDMEVQK